MPAIQIDAPRTRLASAPVKVVTEQSPLSSLVMTPAVLVAPDCTLSAAAATMERMGVSAVLVGERLGLVTDREIARALVGGAGVDERVSEVATRNPIVVPASTTVVDACATMLNEQAWHVVVALDEGLAVVSLRELAAVLLQHTNPDIWLASLRAAFELPSEVWLG